MDEINYILHSFGIICTQRQQNDIYNDDERDVMKSKLVSKNFENTFTNLKF